MNELKIFTKDKKSISKKELGNWAIKQIKELNHSKISIIHNISYINTPIKVNSRMFILLEIAILCLGKKILLKKLDLLDPSKKDKFRFTSIRLKRAKKAGFKNYHEYVKSFPHKKISARTTVGEFV